MYSGIKANLNVCAVGAGFEEECVTLLAELVRLLGLEYCVDLGLNFAGGHAGIEDQNVGTKVKGMASEGSAAPVSATSGGIETLVTVVLDILVVWLPR